MYKPPDPPEAQAQASAASLQPPKPPPASWAMRVLLGVAIVFVLQLAKPLMLPLVIALAFTFVLSGPVRRLRRVGIPEAVGAGLVVAATLCVLALAGWLLAGPAAEWWERAPTTVRQLIDSADRVRSAVMNPQSAHRTRAAPAKAASTASRSPRR